MAEFPTYEQMAKNVAEKALDEYLYDGKSIREWIKIIAEQEQKWIPMTTRPMTEEEKEKYREQLEYVDDAVIFNCSLPDDGQEVLITVYGETELDTFYNDAIDGCYFENRDIEDVTAWMPKPKPYEPQESDEISKRNMKMWEELFKAESEDKK